MGAPSHPSIQLNSDFVKGHPAFAKNVERLSVHMEDTTKQPPVVHWDAEYDVSRFMRKEHKVADIINLPETLPAVPGSGKQVRFMTFCPQDGPHTYSLKVTAIDKSGEEMELLKDAESTYE